MLINRQPWFEFLRDEDGWTLKPHCIQSSRVLVPAGTSKSTLRRHGIQAATWVMAYVAHEVML
jgi:hypothetical protein